MPAKTRQFINGLVIFYVEAKRATSNGFRRDEKPRFSQVVKLFHVAYYRAIVNDKKNSHEPAAAIFYEDCASQISLHLVCIRRDCSCASTNICHCGA
jgi:hypothetical protein